MSSIQSNNAVQNLARTLMTSLDGDKNGQLSSDEFTSFLSKLLSGVQTNNLAAAAAATPTAGTTAGTTSAIKFEGFDFAKGANPAKSAKYAFAAAAQKSGTMPTSKADAEAWFNSQIKPEMEALGHKIDWVKGDRFQFTNWQGTFVVDYVRGAASSNPALAWQVE
jgi:hypothetical protein